MFGCFDLYGLPGMHCKRIALVCHLIIEYQPNQTIASISYEARFLFFFSLSLYVYYKRMNIKYSILYPMFDPPLMIVFSYYLYIFTLVLN